MSTSDEEAMIVVAEPVVWTDGSAASFKIRFEEKEVGAVQLIRTMHTGVILIDIDVGVGSTAVRLEFSGSGPGPLNAGLAARLWKQAVELVETR